VVEELKELKIATESQGAICIFFEGDPALEKAAPMIIQKADGASLYATTDLATVRYRFQEWKADKILYVTDARQQLHFKQLFAATQKWFSQKQWTPPTLWHVIFGSILGPDRKPIKTRTGDPIKLNDLLDEGQTRALKIIQEKNPELSEAEQQTTARVIGIGALKYADLCQNRELDYLFDWNKLLAFQGNTAPYLIYAYVRIRSIFRSSGETSSTTQGTMSPINLSTPEELALAKHLIQFSDTVHSILNEYRPHLLTNYLYELAVKFSKFYEACPVLKAEEPTRSSRLALSDITSRILKKGLNLLGIEALEKM
jgi:arginyl-tRNA synthetase